jgi:signal transduction histidine kinase
VRSASSRSRQERGLPSLPGIERRNWWLWGVTFALILTLGCAVVFFSASTASNLAQRVQTEIGMQVMLSSLFGLILLFCLYLILKQRELLVLRRRLFDENRQTGLLQAHVAALTNLLEAAAALGLSLDTNAILEAVIARIRRALEADRCAVLLREEESGRLLCRAAEGFTEGSPVGADFDPDRWARLWAPGNDAPLAETAPPDGTIELPGGARAMSSLAVPLRLGETFFGVLIAARAAQREPFGEHQARLFSIFAALVSNAVERASLYERLGRRAQSLEAANKKLQELNEVKEMFLTTVSHELKTPLTSILSCADVLAYEDLTDDDRRRFVATLRSQGRTLLGLMEDLMDLSRLRLGLVRLNVGHVLLNDVVEAGLESAGAIVAAKKLELAFHRDPALGEVDADETKIVQVVLNLVGNAAKFTDPGGRIEVSTRALGEEFEVSVSDNGRGIPPEGLGRIFDPFARLEDPAAPKTRGMGVGLHLVKQIVDLHGGRVTVESEVGVGSVFRCRFPVVFRETPSDGSAQQEDPLSKERALAA